MGFFNDALNTFYLLLYYGIGHMVKDHLDSKRGNPLLLFPISSKGSVICTMLQTGYHIQPLLPVVEHMLKIEMAEWEHNRMRWRSILNQHY